MVSRKRTKGKARKAAKAKAREEAEERRRNNDQATDVQQQQSLESQMQRLQVRKAPIAGDSTRCKHGRGMVEDICVRFVTTVEDAFNDINRGGDHTLSHCLLWAYNDTLDEFAEVWNDSAEMELALSYLVACGAQHILKGNNDSARGCAIFARYFEQYIAVELHETQALINWPKIADLTVRADEHTLVKFFRRRVPCTCLDEKYEKVKHITKLGLCYNPQCSLPAGQVELSKTMYCSRCRSAVYCSHACQKADWPRHQEWCDMDVAMKAEFDAEHQKTQKHERNIPIEDILSPSVSSPASSGGLLYREG